MNAAVAALPGVITNPADLVPGTWYCIGFERFAMLDKPEMQWGEILFYAGPRDWYDQADEAVYSLFDPELQMPVAMDAADAYARQA